MHVIAYVYHWERDTVWNLTVRERRMWVTMITEQKRMENAPLENMKNKKRLRKR